MSEKLNELLMINPRDILTQNNKKPIERDRGLTMKDKPNKNLLINNGNFNM